MRVEPKSGGWTPPESFEEYRVLRLIGGGAMGRVYLAHDLLLDRQVAIKFIAQVELSPGARERFFREARAVARLKHPNVVAVHRVGTVLGRPYLVSEYLDGTSLDHLDERPRGARLVEIALGLVRGLAAAHRAGVLHRDVKPANAMLTSEGEVKLLDFGLAKLHVGGELLAPRARSGGSSSSGGSAVASPEVANLTVTESGSFEDVGSDAAAAQSLKGRWVGTPRYMAPEVWRFEEATPASDVYSMGALLYELATGESPHAELAGAALAQAVQAGAPSLAGLAPDVDPRFVALVDRCLAVDLAERFAHADALREAVEQIAAPVALAAPVPANPYRGLHAFEAEHRAVFFGRAAETRAVLERLRSQPLVVVVGSSGAGKSSLCRAGVLPAVEAGALGRSGWRTVTVTPGAEPVASLAAALSPSLATSTAETERQLREEPRAVARRLSRSDGVILFVDQLEELVTLASADDASAAARAIAALAERIPGVAVVTTVRSDFLAQVADLPDLGTVLVPALYLLGPLSPAGLREAIVGPAAALGVRFESDAMVDALAAGAGSSSGGLPLLQFALAELWEAREGHVIAEAALARMGGVEGALAGHADRVVAALGPEDRVAARQVLLRLVSDERTRARRPIADVVEGDPRRQRALEALVRGRLVLATDAPTEGGSTCELAHEALLTGWPMLAEWVDGGAAARAAHERLRQSARDWARLGRAREALWQKRQLDGADAVDRDALAPLELEFLGASRRHQVWTRVRRGAAVLAGLLLAVALWVGFRMQAARELDHTVDGKIQVARAALAEGAALEEEAAKLRAASVAAHRAGDGNTGTARWREMEARNVAADRRYADAASALEGALELAPEANRLRAAYADVLLARVLWAETAGEHHQRPEYERRLARYDDDGSRRRRLSAPTPVELRVQPEARLTLFVYREREKRLVPAATELASELAPGSYLLIAEADGHSTVRLPFVAERGVPAVVALTLPRADAVPAGFLYVPPGPFLAGSDATESMRLWLNSPPMHREETDAYFIARTEVTWGEWIEFLDALPPSERARHTPAAGAPGEEHVKLEQDSRGWLLRIRPAPPPAVASVLRPGELLRYEGRTMNQRQDWLRLPVAGVSALDGRAYARWLDSTGRVPGARLCTFLEWERAGRGADGRAFPGGHALAPDDANFDHTYGRVPTAIGPDEVGLHGDSPFGAKDMSGNLFEWTEGPTGPEPVLRGGSYLHAEITNRLDNHEMAGEAQRFMPAGLRICATPH